MFIREDDRISLPLTRRWQHWSRWPRNDWSFRIFELAASSFLAFKVEFSCKNSANSVKFTQNISASVNSFVDKWSFIRSSRLKWQLMTNQNIHVVIHCSSMNCLIDSSHVPGHMTVWNCVHHCLSSQTSNHYGSRYHIKLIWWEYFSCTVPIRCKV